MASPRFTIYTQTLLFLSLLLFLIGYLFRNMLLALTGTILLVFLVYTKMSFKPRLEDITITRTIIEKIRYVNHPINIKTIITSNNDMLMLKATDVLPDNAILFNGSNTTEQLVKSGEKIVLEYQIQFTTRGSHSFTGVDLELNDPWHLYTFKTTKPHETSLMVHSDPAEIQKAKRVSTREHIEITMPSFIGTETQYEMEGIRDYIPGDRLKDVDWKATSRLQKLLTKLFQKKEVVDTVILIDCSRSMRRTTSGVAKIDHATRLAIHLTKILQSFRHRVGLIAYDEFKTLTTIEPTNYYHHIFEELTKLPSHIPTQGYTPNEPEETKETITSPDQQRFIATVFPFLAKGKRSLRHPLQASGIYEAMRLLLMDTKSKHLIIITDMETNPQSLYRSVHLARAQHYNIWLLTSFTPYYNLDKTTATSENIENIYHLQTAREKALLKLKKLNIAIIELTPTMEGGNIIENIRRKRP